MRFFEKTKKYLADLLFPVCCMGCGERDTALCYSCLATIPRARSAEHPFIHPLFDYRDPLLKKAIWRFKYAHTHALAESFAHALYEEIIGVLSERLDCVAGEKVVLIPIPLHPKRLRERGYNQSGLLVRALREIDDRELFEVNHHALKRAQETPPQAHTETRTARVANMRGAFRVADNVSFRDRIVILIDDVTTTGATLYEAKRALAKAHPRAVLAFTVGH